MMSFGTTSWTSRSYKAWFSESNRVPWGEVLVMCKRICMPLW